MRHYEATEPYDWSGVAHVGQYFGAWAMPDENFRALAATILDGDLAAHVREVQAARREDEGPFEDRGFALIEGTNIALIELKGTMTKYGSSFSDLRHGTIGVRRAIRSAAEDGEVGGILLRIDSPGGSVSGTGDLAEDVAKVSARKPVYAYIEDLGASAAYWVASQATLVFANQTAIVGSIGTYGIVTDTSERLKREGVKVHVIRAGTFKGMGTPGAEVTDEHLAEMQRTVDSINELFIEAIVKGRGLKETQVRGIATGAVWIGADAAQVGLIDGVEAIDGVIARLQGTIGASPTQTEIVPMAGAETNVLKNPEAGVPKADAGAPEGELSRGSGAQTLLLESQEPKAVGTRDLLAAFPDSTAEWREQCTLEGRTMEQATGAWIKHLEQSLKDEREARGEAENAAKAVTPPGAEPNTTEPAASGAGTGDPVREWRQRFGEVLKAKGGRRAAALKAMDREHPGLRQAFVTAVNQQAGTPVPILN